MRGRIISTVRMALPCLLIGFGCASNPRVRVSTLQKANNNLTERLNQAQLDLVSSQRNQSALDARLVAALDDAENLRQQIVERPVPETAPNGWTPIPGGAMITIEDNILFASGKTELRRESRRTLGNIINTLRNEYGTKDILVFGHTDDQPIRRSGWKDNYELSAQRALSVVRYLGENGINQRRLIAGGCGEHRPRTSSRSASSRAKNRRVEIYAIDSL